MQHKLETRIVNMINSKNHERITCKVCHKIYNNPHRLRKCHHTFCLKCIQQHEKCGLVTCPICHERYTQHIDLQIDKDIKQLVDDHWNNHPYQEITGQLPPAKCGMCENSDKPVSYECEDCDKLMCDPCKRIHSNIKPCQSHTVKAFHNIRANIQQLESEFESILLETKLEDKFALVSEILNQSKAEKIQEVREWTENAVKSLHENQTQLVNIIEKAAKESFQRLLWMKQQLEQTRKDIRTKLDKMNSVNFSTLKVKSESKIEDIEKQLGKFKESFLDIDRYEKLPVSVNKKNFKCSDFINLGHWDGALPASQSIGQDMLTVNTLPRHFKAVCHQLSTFTRHITNRTLSTKQEKQSKYTENPLKEPLDKATLNEQPKFQVDEVRDKTLFASSQDGVGYQDKPALLVKPRIPPKLLPKPNKKSVLVLNRPTPAPLYKDLRKQIFTIKNNAETGHDVHKLCEIGNNIWCGGENKITVFNKQFQKINIMEYDDMKNIQALALWYCHQQVIVACDTGLYSINTEGLIQKCIVSGDFSDICVHGDNLYALEYRKEKVIVWNYFQNRLNRFKEIELGYKLCDDSDKLCVSDAGFYISSDRNKCIYTYNTEGNKLEGKSKDQAKLVLCGADQEGTLLVAGHCQRFKLWINADQETWHQVPVVEPLPEDLTHCLLDTVGNLWVVSLGGNIIKYENNSGMTSL